MWVFLFYTRLVIKVHKAYNQLKIFQVSLGLGKQLPFTPL